MGGLKLFDEEQFATLSMMRGLTRRLGDPVAHERLRVAFDWDHARLESVLDSLRWESYTVPVGNGCSETLTRLGINLVDENTDTEWGETPSYRTPNLTHPLSRAEEHILYALSRIVEPVEVGLGMSSGVWNEPGNIRTTTLERILHETKIASGLYLVFYDHRDFDSGYEKIRARVEQGR